MSPEDELLIAGAEVHLTLEIVDSLLQDETDLEYLGNVHQQAVDTDHNIDFGLPACQLV